VTIGVICAIPQELAHLRAVLSGSEHHQIAHTTFDVGQLEGHRVVPAAAGMGKVNTGLVATLLADRFRCRAIVFTGVAGGLDPELRIGEHRHRGSGRATRFRADRGRAVTPVSSLSSGPTA
jgi:adenosylhomocysteine nucleosidase